MRKRYATATHANTKRVRKRTRVTRAINANVDVTHEGGHYLEQESVQKQGTETERVRNFENDQAGLEYEVQSGLSEERRVS